MIEQFREARDPEAPEADFMEQQLPVDPESGQDEEEAAADFGPVPVEANEADVLEQHQEVPEDDAYPYGELSED